MTNQHSIGYRTGAVISAAAALAGLNACGKDNAKDVSTDDGSKTTTASGASTAAFTGIADNEAITTKEYVGAIEGTGIYAAFVISRENDGGASDSGQAYFCDGQSIANWFKQVPSDDGLQFEARNGDTFRADESDGKVTAEVTLGGTGYSVTVSEVDADGEAGLYLADHLIDADLATDERGGWIVLPDGTQRGAIRAGTTVLPGTNLQSGATNVVVAGRDILLRAITHIIALDKKS